VRYFEFTGGEPFMIPEHFELLQYAVDKGFAPNIDIHYNTNGTQYPEEHLHLWKHFKHVEIAFSIDNVGARFEYERYGAKWDEVESNIKKFKVYKDQNKNIDIQICMTVNTLNVYYLEDLCNWVNMNGFDSHFNMLHGPDPFNIGMMPRSVKAIVIDKLDNGNFNTRHRMEVNKIIQFIKNGISDTNHKFLFEIKKIDQYRKQYLLDTHYEIAKAMGYE
jgi:hypothetical protein